MLTALDIDLKTLLMSKGDDGDEWEEEPDVDSDIEEGDVEEDEIKKGNVDGGDDEEDEDDDEDEEEDGDEEEVV